MWNHLPILLLVLGLLQLTQGTNVATTIYPSCTGTGLPNFSYAKATLLNAGSGTCSQARVSNIPWTQTVNWFYYDTYPPSACGNANLPDGDQCCHTSATSTITYYNTVIVRTLVASMATSTGNVTAGPFLGKSVTYVVTVPGITSLDLNCGTAQGLEAEVGSVDLTISGGPVCLNGGIIREMCPGYH